VQAEKFFTVEGHLNGLGYMVDTTGTAGSSAGHRDRSCAPVGRWPAAASSASIFSPAGYWESQDGMALIRQSADYARQGSTSLSVETLFSVLRPNEPPQITVHLRQASPARAKYGLSSYPRIRFLTPLRCRLRPDEIADLPAPFHTPLPAGFYKVRATYRQQGHFREFYENGFWVADAVPWTRDQPWE
jgi:hypothetical protein